MKIAAISTADAWFTRLASHLGSDLPIQTLEAVPVENTVVVESAYLAFEDEEHACRPFAMIVGRLVSTQPLTELSYGITELSWVSDQTMAYRYDFTDEQLVEMITNKGMYQKGFGIPSELIGIEGTFPGSANFFILAPQDAESVPVVMAELIDPTTSFIDMKSSGYDLVSVMPDRVIESVVEVQHEDENEFYPSFEDNIVSLDMSRVAQTTPTSSTPEMTLGEEKELRFASNFAELMNAAKAKRLAREQAIQREAERVRGLNLEKDLEEASEEIVADVEKSVDTLPQESEDEIMAQVEAIADDVIATNATVIPDDLEVVDVEPTDQQVPDDISIVLDDDVVVAEVEDEPSL